MAINPHTPVNYPPGHTWFVTVGAVSVTSTRDGSKYGAWHVWLFGWCLPQPFPNEVKAVMMLQKLTRPSQKNY